MEINVDLIELRLRAILYVFFAQEGMLECHEFLSWLVDITEKVRPHDDNTFRIVLPFCLQVRCTSHLTGVCPQIYTKLTQFKDNDSRKLP